MYKFLLPLLIFSLTCFEPILAQSRAKKFGVYSGKVIANRDPQGKYRVKVKFPWIRDNKKAIWAKVSRGSNSERGIFFLPEVGDEVIVSFMAGDIRYPVVLGSLWNGVDRPPL